MTGFDGKTGLAGLLWGVLVLGACSGSGGGDSVTGIEGTGDTVVSASGTVTRFGSVYVNGTRFDTADADISIDGESATESQLRAGMTVRVTGTADDGASAARTIVHDRLLRGPVSAVETVDASRKALSVLGQTVIVAEDCVIDNTRFDALAAGMVITVSGLPADDGMLLATRVVKVDDANQTFDVEGAVTGVDSAESTLAMNGLRIDYAQALFEGGEPADFREGVWLEVRGQLVDDTRLGATRIIFKSPLSVPEAGTWTSVEGVVTTFDSADSFVINNIGVDASQARVERGDVSGLGVGVRVSVSGEVGNDGVIVADTIRLVLPNQTRVEGPVEAVDTEAGTFTVLGVVFAVDAMTVFEDRSVHGNRFISLDVINVGDSMGVFGRDIDGQRVATRVVRTETDGGHVVIKGPAVRMQGSIFYITGVMIDASDAGGAALVSTLTPGTAVTVEGVLVGSNAVRATRLEVHRKQCPAPVNVGCNRDEDRGDDGDGDSGEEGNDSGEEEDDNSNEEDG